MLISILLLGIISVSYYFFIYAPMLENIKNAREQRNRDYQQQQQTLEKQARGQKLQECLNNVNNLAAEAIKWDQDNGVSADKQMVTINVIRMAKDRCYENFGE